MENTSASLDLLSKLLAAENIRIIRAKVHTASFDIKERLLTLPVYQNMNMVQELLLSLHEVGHALFTTMKYVDNCARHKKPNFHQYMNIVEDARIERLMKEKFPGARKDFYAGYNYFNEVDFFKIKGKNLDKLSLIDRINLEFKLGFRAGVKFTAEERILVRLVDKAETEDQVFEAAVAIYELAQKQAKEQKEKRESNSMADETDDDSDDEDEDEDEDDEYDFEYEESEESDGETQEESSSDDGEEPEETDGSEIEAAEAETQEAFDDSTVASTDTDSTRLANIQMENAAVVTVRDYKDIVADFLTVYTPAHPTYNKFKLSNQKLVNHMVKEFEMRKAADAYKRTSVSKSGSLDSTDLYKYKIADDIFRRYNIVADSNSHGFIMLVDWSGSMMRTLQNVISQVITLTQFCKRVGIKFEVFAFSDKYEQEDFYGIRRKALGLLPKIAPNENDIAVYSGKATTLFKFFDSKMSSRDFDVVASVLYTGAYRSLFTKSVDSFHREVLVERYMLGGTPLIQGLLYMHKYINEFKQKTGVQKTTFITMTDGESTDTSFVDNNERVMMPSSRKVFLQCKETNRFYPVAKDNERNFQTVFRHSLMTAMKDAHKDVAFVGFFIVVAKRQRIRRELFAFSTDSTDSYLNRIDAIANEIISEKIVEFDTPGYDKFYVTPVEYTDTDINLDGVTNEMTGAQIARQFIKGANTAMKGRVLATRFIKLIA